MCLPAGGGFPHEKSEATTNEQQHNKSRVFADLVALGPVRERRADLAPAEPVRERRLSASGAGEGTQTPVVPNFLNLRNISCFA